MSDDDRYWSVRLIVYAFESEDEAREYQNRLLDAFCALPESAGLGSVASHFEGSSCDEIARLRADVERLTAALANERRHADALADTLHSMDGLQKIDCEMRDNAVQQHRARRQG